MLESPHLNTTAVLVAALLRFVIGFVWWSPPLFGAGAYQSGELKPRMKWAVLASAVTTLLIACWLVQNGYQLLSMLAMGAVLGAWR